MTRSNTALLLLLLALAACDANDADTDSADADTSAAATTTPAAAATDDVEALRDYDLTMEKLDGLFEAQLAMARVASRMTPAEREALAQQSSNSQNASIDDMVANIERNPPFRDALSEAGITPRDYAMTTAAMMQASMAMAVLQMRPNDDPDSLTRAMDTNPGNVRFIQENMEEITRRQEAATAEIERLLPDEAE